MALTLSLYPKADFFVDDTRVTLIHVEDAYNFKLKVHGKSVNFTFNVTDEEATEILPDVRVSSGLPDTRYPRSVKLVVQAPREIRILRGKVYREANPDWTPKDIKNRKN